MADNGTVTVVLPGSPSDSYQPNVIACAVITWVLAAVFVAARFYTRWVIRRVLGWEDWSIAIALLFSAANSAGMIEQAVEGLGKHVWFIEPENIPKQLRAGWYTIIWYVLALAFTKISILLLYLRILTYDWARKATYALLAAVVACNLFFSTILTLTACKPMQGWWDVTVPAKCLSQDWWWANTGMHMITDFLIFLLPLPLIATLRVQWRQKMLLYGIFTFGFFICAISILRLVTLINFAEHTDFTYDNVGISYWSCIEINSAIICACQMTLKPLLSRFFPSLLEEKPARDAQQHAVVSIGGRPIMFFSRGRNKDANGNSPNPVAANSNVNQGPGIRLDSDAPIIEEDRPVSLHDIDVEAQKGEGDGLPTAPARVHVRDVPHGSSANTSTDHLSELGPEARQH